MVGPDGPRIYVENVVQFMVEALHMVPDPRPLFASTGDNAPPLSITITG